MPVIKLSAVPICCAGCFSYWDGLVGGWSGLKVVRLAAKSREAVSSSVDFLTLHTLVRQLGVQSKNELYKLQLLKDAQGKLFNCAISRYH
jgi:hypothetical protein